MDLVGYWKKCVMENYANFSGRARRAEYWSFWLANVIVLAILFALTRVSGLFFILYLLYGIALIVPGIAAGVRRLHDTGKSGWMLLISFIPLVGAIILLVFLFTDSTKGSNQYGVSEKYPA
ncbi:MAG: hypothetical protein RL238_825 [Actinomycetota bacterium]|jgi:uncharacterized membrane protein YhaH (DUF805 family)